MTKTVGILSGMGLTIAGILWYYGILYNWLWLGIVHSSSTGWIVGYAVLFIIFVILTIPITILLFAGYAMTIVIGLE